MGSRNRRRRAYKSPWGQERERCASTAPRRPGLGRRWRGFDRGKQKLGPISKQGDRYFRRMRSGCGCACAATALPSPAIKSCRRNGFTPHSINLAVANSVSGIVRPRFWLFISITSWRWGRADSGLSLFTADYHSLLQPSDETHRNSRMRISRSLSATPTLGGRGHGSRGRRCLVSPLRPIRRLLQLVIFTGPN